MNGRQLQFRTPQNFYADINLNRRIADREGIDDVVVIAHFGGHYDYTHGYDMATQVRVYAKMEETRK